MATPNTPSPQITQDRPPNKPRVTIPLLTDQESVGKIDQTETVIVNGYVTRIQRGVSVEVTPEVFEALRIAYPNI